MKRLKHSFVPVAVPPGHFILPSPLSRLPISRSSAPVRQSVLRRQARLHSAVPSMSDSSVVSDIPDVLKKILTRKATEVAALRAAVEGSAAEIEHAQKVAEVMRQRGKFERSKRFVQAVKMPPGCLTVIAEIKRRSPSKGEIGRIPDAGALSRVYWEGGAGAVSVLTDGEGFGGSIDDLKTVVEMQKRLKGHISAPCPVLRKEFIVDEVQVAEARVCGADAVLLIVAALGEKTGEFLKMVHEYGLDALVEVHDEHEMKIAIEAGAEVIGINNRDLRTFEVSLDTCLRLKKLIPEGVVAVAESGIEECLDAWKLRDAGFSAILVGETLVKAAEQANTVGSTSYTTGFNTAKGMIRGFKAKGSVKYGPSSAAAFSGKGEGASERLGELLL